MADSRVDWMRNKGGNATHHFVLFDLPSSCLLVLLLFLVPNFSSGDAVHAEGEASVVPLPVLDWAVRSGRPERACRFGSNCPSAFLQHRSMRPATEERF